MIGSQVVYGYIGSFIAHLHQSDSTIRVDESVTSRPTTVHPPVFLPVARVGSNAMRMRALLGFTVYDAR